MRRFLPILLTCALLLTLTACYPDIDPPPPYIPLPEAPQDPAPPPADPEPDKPASPDTPALPTPAPGPGADTPAPDPTPTPEPETVPLSAGTALFTGPGFDSLFDGTLATDGAYPVEEKGESGWVRLTDPAAWVCPGYPVAWADSAVLIYSAEPALLAGSFIDPFPTAQCVSPVAVRAQQTLTDLRLVTLVPGAVLEEHQTLLTLPELLAGDPLVLRINFPGSASLYGLSFADTTGTVHKLVLSESGMDGSLFVGKW